MKYLLSNNMETAIKIGIGLSVGFSAFWLISHPKSKARRKLPSKNFKSLHFSPNIRIVKKNKAIHLHHWAIFTSIYLHLLFKKRNFLRNRLLHGFIIGSIIQGLSFKDRFRFVYPFNHN